MLSRTYHLNSEKSIEQIIKTVYQLQRRGSNFYNFKAKGNRIYFCYDQLKFRGIPIVINIWKEKENTIAIKLEIYAEIKVLTLIVIIFYPVIYLLIRILNINLLPNFILTIFPIFYILFVIFFLGYLYFNFGRVFAEIRDLLN